MENVFAPVLLMNGIDPKMVESFYDVFLNDQKYYVSKIGNNIIIIDEMMRLYEVYIEKKYLSLKHNGEIYTDEFIGDNKYCSFLNKNQTIAKALCVCNDSNDINFCQTNFITNFSFINVYNSYDNDKNDYIKYLDKRLPYKIEMSPNLNNEKARIVFLSKTTVNGPRYHELRHKFFKMCLVGKQMHYSDFYEIIDLNDFSRGVDKNIVDWYLSEGPYDDIKKLAKKYK